ncbi:myb-like protein V [Penaeus chinensis]|uniref:myb-like protein V n=1 Tax=Penaeus chinensis TaxID=139456 RepID=UPI001FB5BBD1|nr:myb-like protein V [Penaeus chinensis]
MVDTVSAEERRKELLEDSQKYTYPEDSASIKLRYKDTALVLFKEGHDDPKSFLSFGTRRSSSVSQYGNTPLIVRRSQSSNGELSMVAEQWPSISCRTSVSNYTLVEAGERDDDDSETEDELDVAVKNISGELQDLKETEESEGSVADGNEDATSESGKQSVVIRGTKGSETTLEVTEKQQQASLAEEKGTPLQAGEYETRKSFIHYDLPIQRPKSVDKEKNDKIGDESHDQEKSVKEQEDETHEVQAHDEKQGDSAKETAKDTGREIKLSVEDQGDSADEKQVEDRSECPSPKAEESPVVDAVAKDKESTKTIVEYSIVESHKESVLKKDEPLVDTSPGRRNNGSSSLCQEKVGQDPFSQRYSQIFRTELKIVEASDLESNTKSTVLKVQPSEASAIAANDEDEDDDDDIEFVDAISPVSPKIDIRSEGQILAKQSVAGKEEKPTVAPDASKTSERARTPSLPPQVTTGKEEGQTKKDSANDLNKSFDPEESTKFLDLPVRSPTPPKKSPRRSPRSPKSKEASKSRHSSLVSPLDPEPQAVARKGTRSASPTTKTKEHGRVFTFSLKREKSKSASSLHSRRSKDKDRSSVQEEKEAGMKHQVLLHGESDDMQLESLGKRVGVRSMVIDGTIKRNFIVIHPSDESDTIGLAPRAVISNGDGNAHIRTPKALSSVKSHISGLTSNKIESVQKISLKHDIKEELTDTVRDSVSSPTTLGPVPKRSRSRKTKSTDKIRASSHSLSSYPASDNQLQRTASGMSEVDCDSVNMSSQSLHVSTNKITSKLCSIM